jgi:type 1 glutamine amidotransferase
MNLKRLARTGPSDASNMMQLFDAIRYLRSLILLLPLVTAAAAAEPTSQPKIVFMIGEDEYKTWETLPEFAKTELEPNGYRVSVIQADNRDKNNFPGIVEALPDADLLFISIRRRTPPKAQLAAVRAHLDAGKPLVGIRTACHAFAPAPKDKDEVAADPKLAAWAEFDPEVLGGHYTGHYGNGPNVTISVAPGASQHPILRGVDVTRLAGNGSLYKVSPVSETASLLLLGAIPGEGSEPVAWTRIYGPKKAPVFYTSLGHPDDLKNREFRHLLVNGIRWALQSAKK